MQLSFEEAYNQYLKYVDIKLKPQSKRAVKDRIENHILPYFKDYNIYSIKEIDILNWQYEIEKMNYSYKYEKTLHTAMVTFLNYCIKFLNLSKNVASNVGTFKDNGISNSKIDFYTYDEFKLFISNVEDDIYKQFFTFMFFVGTRPGETMALRFSDLNNNIVSINKTISERCCNGSNTRVVNSPKTKSSIREIEIDSQLNCDLLKLKNIYIEKYKIEDFDYYIFGGIKPLATTTINRHKLRACELSSLKSIRLHDFRHSHATLLLDKKMYLKEISRRLGHSNVSTTLNIYVHTDKSQEKKVIETLNSLRLN